MKNKIIFISSFVLVVVMIIITILYFDINRNIFLKKHKIQKMIENGEMYNGFQPFESVEIKKVCIVSDGAKLTKYGADSDDNYYGFLAVIEYYRIENIVRFLNTKDIYHEFELTDGISYCMDDPSKLVVIKKNESWMLTAGGKNG